MRDSGEPPEGVRGGPRRAGRGGEEDRGVERRRRAAVAGRGRGATQDVTAEPPPGSGALPILPSAPAVLGMLADFWKSRLAELEGSIAAETRPELLDRLAFEWMCVHGILAGLDHRPGAA